MSKESLQQAVTLAGGQTELARGIRERVPGSKVGQVHIWGWLNTVKIEVPPAEVVLAIADFLEYRMTPHRLRADLYPNPTDGIPPGVSVPPTHPTPPSTEPAPGMAFGEFGEPRSGLDQRDDDRRTEQGPDFGGFGEPRDGDRRQDDRRTDGGENEAAA